MARFRYGKKRSSYNYTPKETKPFNATWIPQAQAYKVSFPYNEGFISLIKSKVPSGYRDYDEKTKEWYFTEEYFDILLQIARIMFKSSVFNIIDKKTVEEYSQGTAMTVQVPAEQLARKFYALLANAGLQLDGVNTNKSFLRKYYLRAAKYYHPDVNPDGASDMSSLNQLWSTLTSEEVQYFK